MKRFLALIVVALFMSAGSAMAQEALKIGYVDMRKAMNECKAGKTAREKLEKDAKEKEAKLEKEKSALMKIRTDFDKKAATMTEKEKEDKQREFHDKAGAFEKMVGQVREDFQKTQAEYTAKLVASVKKAITAVSKEGQYTLVIEKTDTSILYSKDGLDLTSKVIAKMDE